MFLYLCVYVEESLGEPFFRKAPVFQLAVTVEAFGAFGIMPHQAWGFNPSKLALSLPKYQY